mmetsp:Transcript_14805/g.31168  ORF Transcript_14805/g.31168 Transcript_14805/m.31168 type:complete len:300 (-) Transcript_14805:951-1850(-)
MPNFLNPLYDILPLSPLATNIGIVCLAAQIFLTVIFRALPRGPWSTLPGFTAHQAIAFPLMIILTYHGFQEWYFDSKSLESSMITPHDRIFGKSDYYDIPLAIATGAILLWDIPAGLFIPELQDKLMFFHHVGMYFVAATIDGRFCKNKHQMVGYYYASYYFGVIELSSIFLTYVDVFHPKRKDWYVWLHGNHSNKTIQAVTNFLNSGNEVVRVLFAISFLSLRGIYFPYVTFVKAIPDLWKSFENPPEGVPMWTCYWLIGSMFFFAILQAYWGMCIAAQVKKALLGGKKDANIEKKNE